MDWKGENEYRIITNTEQEGIDISSAIIAVHVTSAFSDTCKFVEKIVENKVPIMFYHHDADTNDNRLVPRLKETAARRKSFKKKPKTNVSFDFSQYELIAKISLS